ncbi:MAG: sporulation initiation factor Spo0A C-terminal domain-containing protein [Lachnospiraceae bacterium]|nr:sporulation initiation factor Spo0A C-terminal domain-containing protein [Lachnospiraceae bacterium]
MQNLQDVFVKDSVYGIMLLLGVPVSVQGHRYLEDAIRILLQDEAARDAITKQVYTQIARKHKATVQQVESSIRVAIRTTWMNGRCEYHEHVFGCSRSSAGRPGNKEFLLRIVNYLQKMT